MKTARKVPLNKFTRAQRRFIKALRSGEYRQTTSRLVRFGRRGEGDQFCAMGVACDVIGLECDEKGNYHFNGEHCMAEMPDGSYHKLHLVSPGGASKSGLSRSIISMNDNGSSFEQIADTLEEYPYRYFTNFRSAKKK